MLYLEIDLEEREPEITVQVAFDFEQGFVGNYWEQGYSDSVEILSVQHNGQEIDLSIEEKDVIEQACFDYVGRIMNDY